MLKILRERATSWMLRGLLLLVAVTFVSWGGSYLLRERRDSYAAMVNGVIIQEADFRNAYDNQIRQYRNIFGPSFSEKMIEELHLKQRVLDGLIDKVLLIQEGKRLGVSVGDEELREVIESIPAFQVNGQFDQRAYERALRLNRMSAEDFERAQRENLLILKVRNLVKLNAEKVSEEEMRDVYLFENEKINLSFLKVAPEAFREQVTVNELEIKDYYEKHQEEVRVPTFIQIQYLAFRPSDFEGKVQVSSDEIERYYDRQKDRFKIPPQVRAREILIRVGPEDPPDKVEEKRKKAEEILEKAKKTNDFGSLAKQYSESSSAAKGGEMGWVQKGALGEPIDNVLFSLKKGELSNVIRGRSGFQIYKVEEIRVERQRSFAEVKDQITQALKREKGRAEASRKADDAFFALFRNRELEKYAREKDLPIKTTGLFKEGDEIPEIGRDPSFYASAFSLKVGEISPVVTIPPNFFILKCVDRKESRIPALEEVKAEVQRKVIGVKADEKARQVAENLLREIQKGKTIKEVARERGLQVEETGFFMRAGGIVPKIGPAEGFMTLLASLTEQNPIPKEVFKTKDGYFVVKLSASEPADQNKFPSAKKDLERRLLYEKGEEFFQNWVQQLRAEAKIEINKDVL
jgi:peptidyl-prolyl cis-trans isomerase D